MRNGRWIRAYLLMVLLIASGCGQTVDGVTPVGGAQASQAEIERFIRNLHLDLTGQPPTDTYLAEASASLSGDITADERAALADQLIAEEAFSEVYISELENRAYGGDSIDDRYELLCAIVRDQAPDCAGCAPALDPCGECDCALLVTYKAERDQLASAADDLAVSATTADIERRFAGSSGFRVLFEPNAVANSLFEIFLGRPAEGEELSNASAMVIGALFPGSPAGLLFHRHGSDYTDLLDIVFESEVYREAAVTAVFQRYLGRPPSLAELAHFSASLDPDAPDIRPVIRAVVSSDEYFEL